jgi:hypothetical protein
MATAVQAPSTGGNAFNQTCAADEVVVGFMGTVDAPDASMNWLRGFQAICGTLTITGTGPYNVRTTRAETLPQPGAGMGSTTQGRLCATDQVVVGFSGKAGSYIDQLDFICAPLAISGASPTFTLSVGAPSAPLAPLGGPGGQPFAAIPCGPDQVAVGDTGHASQAVDAFGLLCSTPSLVVK